MPAVLRFSVILACVVGGHGPSFAAKHTVDPGGGGDCTTIGACLALAADGDTVEVLSGTYPESLSINKSVIVRSAAGSASTVVAGPDTTADVVTVSKNGVRLEGLTLQGGREGLAVGGAIGDLTVSDVTIQETHDYPVRLPPILVPSVVPELDLVPHIGGTHDAIVVLGGSVLQSATWPVPPAEFVYYYVGDLTIAGASSPVLRLQAGTILKTFGSPSIGVGGGGLPGGLIADQVLFTSVRDDSGGDTDGISTAPAPANWEFVHLTADALSDSCVLTGCQFRYGGGTVDGAVIVQGINPTIDSCTFLSNRYALDVRSPAPGTKITNNTVGQQETYPLKTWAGAVPNVVSGNTFVPRVDGKNNAFVITGSTLLQSATWPVPPAGFVYYPVGDLTIAGAASPVLRLQAGTIVKALGTGLNVGNGGLPGGLVADQVLFTSVRDDSGGDTDGTVIAPLPANWKFVNLTGDALSDSCILTGCQFRYGGGSADGAVIVEGIDPTVDSCTFLSNRYALDVRNPAPATKITGNTVGQQETYPLKTWAGAVPNVVSGNTYVPRVDGKNNAFVITGSTLLQSATWPVPPAGFVYYPIGDLTIAGATSPVLRLQAGTIVKSLGTGISVGDGGLPGGLVADQVLFTSVRDDSGGDTDGTVTAPLPANWEFVNLTGDALSDSCVLTGCQFRYGGGSSDGTVIVEGIDPTVDSCTFLSNRYAFDVRSPATGAGITNNTVGQQEAYPAKIWAGAVQNVVPGNTFVPRVDGRYNAFVVTESTVLQSATWPVPPEEFVYFYAGDLTIAGAASPVLTLQAGTILKSLGAGITVGSGGLPGGLVADAVLFTSVRDDSGGDTDGGATAPAPANWDFVNLTGDALSDSCILTGCQFRYGGGGTDGAVIVQGINPTVDGCTFLSNRYAFDVRNPAPGTKVANNTVGQQETYPVKMWAGAVPAVISTNTFVPRVDGKHNAFVVTGSTLLQSATWPVPPAEFVYFPIGDLTIAGIASPVLRLQPGTILKSLGTRITVGGGGLPGGLVADRVLFTSVRDDSGGDTDGGTTVPARGNWELVHFTTDASTDSCALAECELRFGGGGVGGMVQVDDGSPSFQRCAFVASSSAGLFAQGAAARPEVGYGAFYFNEWGVETAGNARPHLWACCFEDQVLCGIEAAMYTDGQGDLDARYCWWGSDDGPSGVGPGSGDCVSANVLFVPWLTVPSCGSPPVGVAETLELLATPTMFRLETPYPNPSRGRVTLGLSIPAAGRVEAAVYDVAGRRVRTLSPGTERGGGFQLDWNGLEETGRSVAAGRYFVVVACGEQREVRPIVIVR